MKRPQYSPEGEVAMIAGALTVALGKRTTESQRRVLIKDARTRAYKLWKRLSRISRDGQ